MKELIIMILFGKTILLTFIPINLNNDWIELTPPKAFKAINEGASLNIELSVESKQLKVIDKDKDIFDQLGKHIPTGTIEAIMVDENKNLYKLINTNFSISDFTLSKKGCVKVMLTPEKQFPVGVNFKSVRIKSTILFNNVNVLWKNFSK